MTYEEKRAAYLKVLEERKRKEREERAAERAQMPEKTAGGSPWKTDCRFAEDTGHTAFETAPCQGNAIICRHEKNDGFLSFAKQCQATTCIFYARKER